MSNNLDPFLSPYNVQTIKEIDSLDLPTMQKHHVRILAHCLQILKTLNEDKNSLREWCDNQSKKFDDKKFSDLFYTQINSTATKLYFFFGIKKKELQRCSTSSTKSSSSKSSILLPIFFEKVLNFFEVDSNCS